MAAPRQVLRQAAALTVSPTAEVEARDSADAALRAFLSAVGGRQALVETLELGATATEVDRVLDLLADPRYESWSVARICRLAGLSVADLLTAFRSATLIRAQVKATVAIAKQLPAVVEDVMKRAQPYEETCDVCDGLGQVTPKPTKKNPNPPPEHCRACKATGRRMLLPDLERQKLALDLGDLVKKSGGITLSQQNLTVHAGGGVGQTGLLERQQQALARALAAPLVLDLPSEPAAPPPAEPEAHA